MTIVQKIKQAFLDFKYRKLIFFISMCFSLLYHTSFLVVFRMLEALSPYIQPRYEISEQLINIIKLVNIGLVASMILLCLGIYSAMLFFYEGNLENQGKEKTDELNTQNGQLLKLQNHLIISLSSLVENRDTDTGDHIKKTSAYCRLIAQKALENNIYTNEINEDFIDIIERAAPMHDIGKILVPDAVLKKTGKFTPEEFEQTDKALEIIREDAGSHFDPVLVKLFLDATDDVLTIQNSLLKTE